MPNYDVLIYHAITTDVAPEVGDPANMLGLRVGDQYVCGVYSAVHEGSDGTIVVSATPDNRPLLGVEQLLLPLGPEYVVFKAEYVDEALPLEPGHPAYRRHPDPFGPEVSEL